MTMDDLVTVQVFCSDISLFDTWNKVYPTYFTKELPARAFLGSGPLAVRRPLRDAGDRSQALK